MNKSKDQSAALILKFGTQDFTDPGLLKIRLTLTGFSLWLNILPSKVFLIVNKVYYYSTVMSFYLIRLRERAKYEAVIHCSVLV